jgi:hypothetical protein
MAVGLMVGWGPGCNEGDTITAPTLSATCSAVPSEGSAPLEVAFTLGVSGAEGPMSVQISYGDGSTGSDPDAHHTYEEAGLYTASFTVATPNQSARCATTLEVGPGPEAAGVEGNGNLPPVPVYKTTPRADGNRITGTAPLEVRFNNCWTSDPEGDTLYRTMDLNNDGKLEEVGTTGGSCRGRWTYTVGTWTAKLCITDLDDEGARLHPMECRFYTIVAK